MRCLAEHYRNTPDKQVVKITILFGKPSFPGSVIIMPTPRWHDEDTDALCRYVRGGNAPFSAIASAFGITRNAVAGKIWRLRRRGVLPPGITLPPRDPKPRIRKPRPYVPRKPADGGSARPARTLADLRCCNNPRVPGLSWCLGHCRMVYR